MTRRLLLAFCALFAVCSGCVATEIETGAKHPASPDATPSERPRADAVLAPGFDPFDAYASQAPKSEPQHVHPGAPAAAVWTCTMHPEIRKAEPGNCPICGMKLVPSER
jgi:hypothetical protein